MIIQWWIYIQKFLACAPPPQQDQILSFLHMFSPKITCVGGWRPLQRGLAPPPPPPPPPPTGNPGSAPVLQSVSMRSLNFIPIISLMFQLYETYRQTTGFAGAEVTDFRQVTIGSCEPIQQCRGPQINHQDTKPGRRLLQMSTYKHVRGDHEMFLPICRSRGTRTSPKIII